MSNLKKEAVEINVSQNAVDELVKASREKWAQMVEDSGTSQSVFIACSSEATQFLGHYKTAQDAIKERYGIIVPDLFEGLNVEVSDCEAI